MRWTPVVVLLALSSAAMAHESRPAYLQLTEQAPNEFQVIWKTPMRGEMRLSLMPGFSGEVRNLTPMSVRPSDDASVQSWRLRAVEPLRGQSVRINGLENTLTDALVRVEFANGSEWVRILTPAEPEAAIPPQQGIWDVARGYLMLGVEHIVFGIDHLLFVLALLFLTNSVAQVVKTVTAFTVAHSVTLGLATLGAVHVPPAPVEAVIALSIVFAAGEIIRARHGGASLAARMPWVVAFVFGLLHGFGFAGALSEIGLPEHAIPMALLFFNVGVELGQLIFVSAVLALLAAVRRIHVRLPDRVELATTYAVGCVAMFWVVQRVHAF